MQSTNSLCQYKHVFGKERTGFHAIRVLDVAIGDFLLTLVGSFIIAYFLGTNFLMTFIIIFILGIILHRMFCVNTKINTLSLKILN